MKSKEMTKTMLGSPIYMVYIYIIINNKYKLNFEFYIILVSKYLTRFVAWIGSNTPNVWWNF